MAKAPEPPKTLARKGALLWRRTLAEMEFSPSERALLESLCGAFDVWSDAQAHVKSEGVLVLDRFGAPKANPATSIARDAAATMSRLANQLDLELAAGGAPSVRHPHAARPGPRR